MLLLLFQHLLETALNEFFFPQLLFNLCNEKKLLQQESIVSSWGFLFPGVCTQLTFPAVQQHPSPAPCPCGRKDISALSQGLGLQLKRRGRRALPAPAVLFAACYDLKKENVGPKQKFQLYQLVWTELTASMRKGAVPTHRARQHSPGKCPEGLLGKK